MDCVWRCNVSESRLRVFTFSPAWGLPTGGPFGLKLEACLRMLGVDYERVFENDNRKGPKRKSPWIEDGDVRIGDTELILEHVARKYGKRLDEDLSPLDRARGHVLRRTLEENFHAVFEWELFVNDEGFKSFRSMMAGKIPLPFVVAPLIRSGFRKHLFERGIGRHEPAAIEAMGRADVDAVVTLLGDEDWLLASRPTKTDASAFGLLAAAICSDLPTPVATYARSQKTLVRYVERARAQFFPELDLPSKERAPPPPAGHSLRML